MPLTRQELEQAVIDALPVDGTPMVYDDLVTALNGSGHGQAVPMLRGMKHRQLIGMRVRREEIGNVLEVFRVQGV